MKEIDNTPIESFDQDWGDPDGTGKKAKSLKQVQAFLKKQISDIQDDIYVGGQVQFEFGAIGNEGSLIDNTIRCRSQRMPISGTPGNINFNLHVAPTLTFNSANAYLGETFVKAISLDLSYSDDVLTIGYDGTYDNFIISFKHSDNSQISESEVQQCYFILVATNIKQKVTEISDSMQIITQDILNIQDDIYVGEQVQFEFGAINVSNGALIQNNIRVRTKPVYFKQIEGTITLQYSKTPALVTDSSVKWGYLGDTPIKVLNNSTLDDRTFSFISDGTFDNIRFTLKHSDNSEITQSELEQCFVKNIVSSIEEIKSSIIEIKEELANSVNPFKGLRYVALGDSITYGFIPRNYAGYPGQLDSYAKLAAQKLGMTFDNYGISGSTLASNPSNPTANSPMSRRYMNMPNDADVISVMGGTNDIRKGITLGTFTDRTDSTYYGALHVILGGLYKKYIIDQGTTIGKTKKIFICTPPKLLLSSGNVEGGTGTLVDMDAWCAAIKEVAAYYSIPVLDFQNLSGVNPHLNQIIHGTDESYTAWYNPYITDGTHPTQEGAEIMADVLVRFLKGLK